MKIVLKIVGYLTLDANSMGAIWFWVHHFKEAVMRVREDTALLPTHEDLFGGVIICWFLRWMECVVGNEKTIILIMTWLGWRFRTTQHKSSIARLPGFALYAKGLWHPVHAEFRMQLGVWLFARFCYFWICISGLVELLWLLGTITIPICN